MNYILRNAKKFKEELLSKALYDFLKYITVLLFATLLAGKLFNWFEVTVVVPVWLGISALIISNIFTAIICNIIANKSLMPYIRNHRTDELTQVFNTTALNEDLSIFINKSKIDNSPLSLILIDIDNFKAFNSEYNSIIADEVLAKFGEILKSDKRITDDIYRQHKRGDEFVIITRNTSLSNARTAAERKKKAIEETTIQISRCNQLFKLTACFAIVELNMKDDVKSLLERASLAMNHAKEVPGKNSIKTLI